MDGVGRGTGTTGHRGRWAGLVVGGVVLAVLAVAGAFTVSSRAGLWVLAALAAALLLGGATAAWAGRTPTTAPTPRPAAPTPAAPGPPVREVDDLQAFFDVPPGSPAGAPADPPADVKAADEPAPPPPAPRAGDHERATARRIAVGLTAAAVVVVVGALVAAALTEGDRQRREGPSGSAGTATGSSTTGPSTTGPSTPAPTPEAAPLTAAAAGDLAAVSVPLGDDGLAARLSFGGIVLEPRAVGATVTTPAVVLTTDGVNGLVQLTLPTWNCLEAVAPVDPAAAGCTPAPTEYADLGTPELQLVALGGEFEVSGDFPTYTRPNGSAPAYTGRSYALTVQAGPDGRFRDGTAPAVGEFLLGSSSTSTLPGADLSVVQAD